MATTISLRELNEDPDHAKRAANGGPVLVTDDGEPAFALLSMQDYNKVSGAFQERLPDAAREVPSGTVGRTLLELMDSLPRTDFDFEPPRLTISLRPVDLE